MAITVSTAHNSGNQASTSQYTANFMLVANTKMAVFIITGYDTSDTDSVTTDVTYHNRYATLLPRHRSGSAFIQIAYLSILQSDIGTQYGIVVSFNGTVTDAQVTLVPLVSTLPILYDSVNQGDNTGTSHAVVINPAKTGAVALGGIVDVQGAVTNLSVTASYGTEITGSEADMGSQVVGCAYRAESGGTCEIRWTKSASATSYAQIASFFEQTPPNTTLGTPADNSTLTDTTPALAFTGTDAEGDTVDYEVQICESDAMSADIEYARVAGSAEGFYASANAKISQSFTGDGRKLVSISLWLAKANNPTGNLTVKLCEHTGTYGTNSTPSTVIETSSTTLDVSTLTTTSTEKVFAFAGTYTLVDGTYYTVLIEWGGANGTDNVMVEYLGNVLSGNRASYTTTWNYSVTDLSIRVTAPSSTFIDALSTDHTGFSAGASHPTASGVEQTYTVQTALTASTYYWRARAMDPTGSNTWGAWSSIQHFHYSLDDKTGTFSISGATGFSVGGQKSNVNVAVPAFNSVTSLSFGAKKNADRALGTIGTASTGLSFAGGKLVYKALGVIGTATTGLSFNVKKNAQRALGTIGTSVTGISLNGKKNALLILSISNSTGFTVAGKKQGFRALGVIGTAVTDIVIFGSPPNEAGEGSFVIYGTATFAVTGKKNASKALDAISSATGISFVAKKNASRILGTIGTSVTGFTMTGKKQALRALGTIGTAVTGLSFVSKKGAKYSITITNATGINLTGKKSAMRALGTIGTASTAFNTAGKKGASRALGSINAVTGFTLTSGKLVNISLGVIGTAVTGISLAGKKNAMRAVGVIGTATTGFSLAGIKQAMRALGTIGTASTGLSVGVTTNRRSPALTFNALASFEAFGMVVLNGRFAVWTGSQWQLCPAKVWDGSQWVIRTVRVYNGSTWT